MFFKTRNKNCEVIELEEPYLHNPTIGHTASSVGNLLVVFGGIENTSFGETRFHGTRIFDMLKEQWKTETIKNEEKIEKRYFHSSIVNIHEEEIFIFGGKSARYFHNDVFQLNLREMSYHNIVDVTGDIPSPRYGHSSASIRNSMYVFGGMDRNGFLHNDLHSFEFESRVWVRFSTDIVPRRYFHSLVSHENELYITNGKTKTGEISDMHKLDLKTLKSELLFSGTKNKKMKKFASWGHSSFVFNNKIYSFGGLKSGIGGGKKRKVDKPVKILREYDSAKREWREISFPGSLENIGSGFGTVTIWRSKLVFLGGIVKRDGETLTTKSFIDLFNNLPQEIYRIILSFCGVSELCRLSESSISSPFCSLSNEDEFWEHKIEDVRKNGIRKYGFTPESSIVVDCSKKENKKKNLVGLLREYHSFIPTHFCFDYDRFIGDKDRFLDTSANEVRVVVVGDNRSGKIRLLHRAAYDKIFYAYIPTLGQENPVATFDLLTKTKKSKKIKRREVKISFWDAASQDEFKRLRCLMYDSGGDDDLTNFMVCFNMNDRKSFENVKKWVSEIQFFNPNTPMVLCGCQPDYGDEDNETEKEQVEVEEVKKLAKELSFMFWNITSSPTRQGINNGFLEFFLVCDKLRRNRKFMKMYEKLRVDKLARESDFYKGEVEGFTQGDMKVYNFKRC